MAEMLSKEGTERAATRSAERRAFRRAANAEQFRRAQQRLATLEARLESLDEAKLVARLGQIYEPAEIAFPPSVEAKREYDSVSHALANREILARILAGKIAQAERELDELTGRLNQEESEES